MVYLLRYGSESLGKHFFGMFENPNEAHELAREYNNLRGGKYPEYEIQEYDVNKISVFMDVSCITRNVNDKMNYEISKLAKTFKNDKMKQEGKNV